MDGNNYGWGNAAADILGAIMKRNADRANAKALTSLYAPIEANTSDITFQDQASRANPNSNYMGSNIEKKTAQGLLPTGFQTATPDSSMVGQGLLSMGQKPQVATPQQTFFNMAQIKPTDTEATTPQASTTPATTPIMGQYAKENNPANISSTPKDWAGIQKDIQQQGYKRIQELAKTMSSDQFRTYLPEARRVISDQITQSKTEYDQKVQDNAYASFENETDPKKKIMIGMKAGLIGKEGAMMLIQPDTESKVINTGGANVVVGFNKLTGRYTNLKDGSNIDPEVLQEMIKPTLTPAQIQQAELTREGHALTARGQDISARNVSTRGGGGGGGRAGGVSDSSKMQMYKWASGFSLQPTGETDVYGKPVMTRVQNNPQLAEQLAGELGYGGQGGGQQGGEDPRIAQARAAGYTDEQIKQFIGGGVQSQQPQVTSSSIPDYKQFGTESTPDMLQSPYIDTSGWGGKVSNFIKGLGTPDPRYYDEYGRPL